ncbi:MAG: sensor histidine kinase [Bacteroidia bacterium]|nr:sensor histidine kinase [Bacteroidia bacterium]
MEIVKKIIALKDSFSNCLSSYPEKALQFNNQARILCNNISHPVLSLQLSIDQASLQKYLGNLQEAINLNYQNLSTVRPLKNDSLSLLIFSDLGVAYAKLGLNDSALNYHLKTLELAEKTHFQKEIIRSLYFLGALHNSINAYDKAFEYFSKCHQSAMQSGNDYLIAYSLDGLASNYFLSGKLWQAKSFYSQSSGIYSKLNKQNELARSYLNLGSVYDELQKPDTSLLYYQKALNTFEKLGAKNDVVLCYMNIGATYETLKKNNLAFDYYFKAEKVAEQLKTLDNLEVIYYNLSSLFQNNKNFESALLYREKYNAIKDSILNIETIKNINELEKKYETEKKEQENKLLVAESALHKRRSNLYLIAACLLLVISVLVYFIFRQRTKNAKAVAEKNEQLYRKKINEIIKEQELKSINEIMEGQENERKRIAEDLHDRLGSMLATIKLHFNAVELKIESLELKSLEQYKKANSLLDEVCDEVRKIAHNMESGVLVNFGLVHALTDLKEALASNSNLEITVNTFGMNQRLGTETEITVYRVIQELLSNVLKHAKATEVSIDLNRRDELLTVIFSDNGIGYVTNESVTAGMGLKNIRSRVEKMHGKFYVDSGQKNGTTNIIEIPLKHDPHSDS